MLPRIAALFTLLMLLSVAMTAATPSTTVSSNPSIWSVRPVVFTITFSEQVRGLTSGELVVTNGVVTSLVPVTAGEFSSSWQAQVTPNGEGTVSLLVPGAVAQTVANENNLASNTGTLIYDTPPIPTITRPVSTLSSITFQVRFDQAWSIGDATAIVVRGAVITSQATISSAPFPYFEVIVAPYASGNVTLTLGAGAFRDINNNGSPAASDSARVGGSSTGSEARVQSLRFLSTVDRSYDTGASVDLEVIFSRPVTIAGPVSGQPRLALNSTATSSVAAAAGYQSVASTSMRMRYTVVSGQTTPALDAFSTESLQVGDQGGIVGDDGYLAILTLPFPGSLASLRGSGAVGVNFIPPKPGVAAAASGDTTDSCGVGSGVGALLAGGLLLLGLRRRNRVA
jgi:hypothetical protein